MTKEELKDQFSVECTEIDTDGSLKVKGTPMDIINWISGKLCLSDVSGSVLLAELFKDANLKDEDGMPVVHYVDKPNGGDISYLRYDAVVKKVNELLKQ